MRRDRTPLRNLLGMLGVALAVVFAAASATSVADAAQHATNTPHEHGLHLTLSQPDHHHDPDAGPHHDGQPDRDDHQTSPGHHHADAPAGALSLPAEAPVVRARAEVVTSAIEIAGPKGVRPGGLDRPPKRLAKLV